MMRDLLVMKQFSLIEIISTATVLLAMVVESSRVFHAAVLTQLHFKLLTGAHLLLMEC